ncbi:MAG: DNA polymerase III subunit gamma/tau [Deltaproteobacteria bacterium]|jgi:DNA polymerase-3 subunit gamma/tau|nr:DNA polymerase III subunit gamma/tau [Deltaproteobacteria bacterium]
MSYLVLARKYRPQSFEEVVDQVHITRTLSNAIGAERVAHAILFSGPRGTGKTTVARILAKAMNCKEGPTATPCNSCQSCKEITDGHAVDVFEIDGASNNSVDQVRELRENIKYMPAHSLHKIYIIDEVHMLSIPAFNALLKTLEEPPSHVMFMFATTEVHKIPITILSRCQRHDFKRIALASISAHLASICSRENFKITNDSLGLIARESGGSMRDAISLLDQVMSCSADSITDEQVLDILGIIDRKYLFELTDFLLQKNISGALDLLDDIYDRGHELKKLYADLLEHFRNLLIVKMGQKVEKLVELPEHEIDHLKSQARHATAAALNQIFELFFRQEASIRFAAQPKLVLEMIFVQLVQFQPALPIDDLIEKLDHLRREIGGNRTAADFAASPATGPEVPRKADGPRRDSHDPGRAVNTGHESEASGAAPEVMPPPPPSDPDAVWSAVYDQVAQENPSLAANLAKCSLKGIFEDRVEIEVVGNGFTLNMIQRGKNMALLNKVFTDHLGKARRIILNSKFDPNQDSQKKKDKNNRLKQEALHHPLVADAIEIFDGKLIDVKVGE